MCPQAQTLHWEIHKILFLSGINGILKSVGKDELGLLPCSIYGQAYHTPCVLGLFGISKAEKNSFGPREAECKINLHNLPGIFYICKACEQIHIPSDEMGRRKKKV